MNRYRWLLAGLLGFGFCAAVGCSQNEKREVRVEEETHEGEVVEESPGEMIVE